MLKKFTNKKGFTLMEMLIVVAIIAILIAVAIPTFNNSLNKARVATDEANIRTGYAAVAVEVLNSKESVTKVYYLNANGTVTADAATDAYKTAGANTEASTVGGIKVGTDGTWEKGATISYNVTADKIDKIIVTGGA